MIKQTKFVTAGVLSIALLGAAGVAWLWFRPAGHGPPQGGGELPEAVSTDKVTQLTWTPTTQLSGTVVPLQSVMLSNEVAGVVRDLGFDSGDVVEAGRPLVVLDTSVERADLSAAEAGVRAAEAEIQLHEARASVVRRNLARLESAVQNSAVSENDVDVARGQLDEALANKARAQAAREQALASVEQIRARIAKKTIVAPFRARAALRSVHPGQYLAENSQIVMLNAVADQAFLDFAIPQEHAARAAPGSTVVATSPLFPEGPVTITVVALDATVNPTTRNVRVRGRIVNPDQRLRPGMFVDVNVPVGAPESHLVVPNAAVRRSTSGDHVFVVGPPGTGDAVNTARVTQKFVRFGPSPDAQHTIVLSGLKLGDQIVTTGAFKLRDGAKIALGPPPGSPGGAAPGAPQGAGVESTASQAAAAAGQAGGQ